MPNTQGQGHGKGNENKSLHLPAKSHANVPIPGHVNPVPKPGHGPLFESEVGDKWGQWEAWGPCIRSSSSASFKVKATEFKTRERICLAEPCNGKPYESVPCGKVTLCVTTDIACVVHNHFNMGLNFHHVLPTPSISIIPYDYFQG